MGNIFSISLPCDAIVSRCWDSISEKEPYVRKLEENLQALTSSLQELRSLKNDVKTRVEVAEKQQFMKRLDQVDNWIMRVEAVEKQVDQVDSHSIQEIKKLCCGGYCSNNYFSTYKYGKKVAKMLVEVTVLKSKGIFEEVATKCLPTALVNERPTEPTVGMELMFEQVWSHLQDDRVGIIGLYGMGGVGKTALLSQINNNFVHTPNDFNLVIWIVVSKEGKLQVIQDKIGEKIGYSSDIWKCKAQHEKAEDIFRYLSQKKFVLLLDDIWEPVELTKVGVPIPDRWNKSKIIFTTRSEDICGHMDAQKKMKVECLTWDKAWDLFKEKVGEETLLSDPDILKLAEIVAKECHGLPLALVTVGRAMACKKTPEEWSRAIQVLKKSASKFSGMADKVFALLKFSYDNLPSECEKVKSCFLYCALFPEDFPICKDDLLYSWMAEELLGDYANVDEAKNESYHIIGTLQNSCLLEDYEGKSVKMHDMIRHMALWLACDSGNEHESFLVRTGAYFIEAPYGEKWKSVKRVSLMANEIERLEETPESPNLSTLFLGRNNLKVIAEGFFDHMPNLRVLDLSENKNITRLPSGVSNLVSLQYLNLSNTDIRELPIELKALVRLKYLNFEHIAWLDFIPPEVLPSLSMLKVLRTSHCGYMSNRDLFDSNEGIVKELQGLEQFDVLTLSIRTVSCFKQFFNYPHLVTCTRTLSLHGFDRSTSLDISSLADMKRLKSLLISNCYRLEQLGISWDSRRINQSHCFLSLQYVTVSACARLPDLAWLIFAPNLLNLTVSECYDMEKVILFEIHGVPAPLIPFAKLAVLHLSNLPLLKSINKYALPFPYLNEIHVSGCSSLKKLPLNRNSASRCKVIQGDEKWWNELEWDDKAARNVFLPRFIPLK